ncbi:hypothetical protein GmHk_12G034123 [Glycine max]|nr:hypothetical protein GmHk_12G034123 [Glycine max]
MILSVDHIIGPLYEEGPMDLTLLWFYIDHVWIDQSKAKLKLVSHGGKVTDYPTQVTMKGYVDRLGLKALYDAWYMTTNKCTIKPLSRDSMLDQSKTRNALLS